MKTSMILSAFAAISLAFSAGCGLQTAGEDTSATPTVVSCDACDSGAAVPDSGTDSETDSAPSVDSGAAAPDSGTDSAPVADSGLPHVDSGTAVVDSGTDSVAPVPDSGTVATLPDPFKSPAPCVFDVSSHYVSGASSGELRGDLPNMTWTSGMKVVDSDDSGYMGLKYESVMPVGTYGFSYVGYQGSSMIEAWAQYGLSSDIAQMSLAGRSYLYCNWWDAATSTVLNVAQPNCMIQVQIDEVCHIMPAGNMANFAAQ